MGAASSRDSCYSQKRAPTSAEAAILTDLYNRHVREFTADESAAVEFNGVGARPTPDDIDPVDLAAWSSVSRTILNLHETLYRY